MQSPSGRDGPPADCRRWLEEIKAFQKPCPGQLAKRLILWPARRAFQVFHKDLFVEVNGITGVKGYFGVIDSSLAAHPGLGRVFIYDVERDKKEACTILPRST